MKRKMLLYVLLTVCLMARAQFCERAFVHTDKDCYLAGEDMWVKMYVVDGENNPTELSKVGYIEVCGVAHSEVLLKLALVRGSGWGKVRIPVTVPTGVYCLTGYTRFMCNGGEATFFKKQIAIVNTLRSSATDRFEIVADKKKKVVLSGQTDGLQVVTDKKEYANRSKVYLDLRGLPDNSKDITVSVFRNDAFVSFPAYMVQGMKDTPYQKKWLPEYEGHIMIGHLLSKEGGRVSFDSTLVAGVSFVGKDLCFTYGRQDKDCILFNAAGVYGSQEAVVSVLSSKHKSLRIELQSPFYGTLPRELPVLQIHPDKEAMQERSIGVQLQQIVSPDGDDSGLSADKYYNLTPVLSYDLDKYTRFPTMKETFIEFVERVRLVEIDGSTVMQVLHFETKKYSQGKALVLLDGVPIYNHEKILAYNPYQIRQIDIYDEKISIGGVLFDGMISFVSHRGDLPGIRLGEEAQLVVYDCPQMKKTFESPVYNEVVNTELRKPDFRHTLYWNPDVRPNEAELSFYTSDLCGTFKVVVEAVTDNGEIVKGETVFIVNE